MLRAGEPGVLVPVLMSLTNRYTAEPNGVRNHGLLCLSVGPGVVNSLQASSAAVFNAMTSVITGIHQRIEYVLESIRAARLAAGQTYDVPFVGLGRVPQLRGDVIGRTAVKHSLDVSGTQANFRHTSSSYVGSGARRRAAEVFHPRLPVIAVHDSKLKFLANDRHCPNSSASTLASGGSVPAAVHGAAVPPRSVRALPRTSYTRVTARPSGVDRLHRMTHSRSEPKSRIISTRVLYVSVEYACTKIRSWLRIVQTLHDLRVQRHGNPRYPASTLKGKGQGQRSSQTLQALLQ
jgi:hypothetical protein